MGQGKRVRGWLNSQGQLKIQGKTEEGRRAYCQPDDDVGVYRIASTAGVLLVSK